MPFCTLRLAADENAAAEHTGGPRADFERAWRSWPRQVWSSARLTARKLMQRRSVLNVRFCGKWVVLLARPVDGRTCGAAGDCRLGHLRQPEDRSSPGAG